MGRDDTDCGGKPWGVRAGGVVGALIGGQRELEVAPVVLQPGAYWIMGLYDARASVGLDGSAMGTSVAYISLPFSSEVPSSFPAPRTYSGQLFNYWVTGTRGGE